MKRWLPFAIIIVLGTAALVASQRQAGHTIIGPRALMYWLGDAQREVTRVPARLTRLSDKDEIAIGDAMVSRERAPLSESDREMEDYISVVGTRLAARAHRRLPYKFHYLPSRSFDNAFALPGGHVFIGAGLIAAMRSEDELASVLGHELEHVDRRHCAERAQVEAAARKLGVLGQLAALPVELFQAGYTKEQEFDADSEGLRLAVAAGYSPYAAREFFERFSRTHPDETDSAPRTPIGEVGRVPVQTLSDYFRTHPPAAERIAAIDTQIRHERWHDRQRTPLRLTPAATAVASK